MKYRFILITFLLLLSTILVGQQISTKKCKDCGKPLSQCQYNGKHTQQTSSLNGHEYVDLGLTVKWATCNLGASTPKGYGNLYAWGEIKTKTNFQSDGYWYEFDFNEFMNNGDNRPVADYEIQPSKDAATSNWGTGWRMPTKSEFEELRNRCRWTWDGRGYEIYGPNGKSIYLPAAGFKENNGSEEVGILGVYWTSSCKDYQSPYSFSFHVQNKKIVEDYGHIGHSIRPVTSKY